MAVRMKTKLKDEGLNVKCLGPLIAVKDVEVSKRFYENVLFQKVTLDLGSNVNIGEAFSIQQDYAGLVGDIKVSIDTMANDHELYFEEADFDGFEKHLAGFLDIKFVHGTKEYPWGQRVVRFYDPDGHIIEVGESMESIFRRFHSQGMTVEEVASRTSHPVEFVKRFFE
jgi:catechol 2,3-dioxygenase-like lactoylglutathione lyase family enzyme